MSSVRVFLAIPLPHQLKDSIGDIQRTLQGQIPNVRWIDPENLHLTLHFFGEVGQETLEKIRVSVISVRRWQRPFKVEVKGLGAFPNLRWPRTVWLGLDPAAQLRRLHGECRRQLHQAGVATGSGSYSPHVSIGRLRQQQFDMTEIRDLVNDIQVGQLAIDKLVLFESRLHADGAEHIPLLTVNLDDEIIDL